MYKDLVFIAKCLGYAALQLAVSAVFAALTYKYAKPFFEWLDRENTKEKSPVAATNKALGKNQRTQYSK